MGSLRLRKPGSMSLLERITIDAEVVHGRPAVRGTRMRVADVLSLLASGASEAEILETTRTSPRTTSEPVSHTRQPRPTTPS